MALPGLVPRVTWVLPAVFVPSSLFACAVCFGQSDSGDLGRAYSFGVLILMGFTFLILGALVLTVYRIEARRGART